MESDVRSDVPRTGPSQLASDRCVGWMNAKLSVRTKNVHRTKAAIFLVIGSPSRTLSFFYKSIVL